jgi:uncharacterized membrane protein
LGGLVIEESIVIEAPALEVWQFFQDLKRWPKWNVGVTEAELVSGNPWTRLNIPIHNHFRKKKKQNPANHCGM